jgi:Coenzyme PQQ synthesis protein D (PqqD)
VTTSTARSPRRNPDAAFRVIDGQGVIAVPGRSEVHLLNDVGTRIFELVDGQRSEQEIAAVIQQEFEVTEEQAGLDVAEFIDDLSRKGMLA